MVQSEHRVAQSMGTKFQYAINPLAENRKSISFTVGKLDDWDYLKRKTKKGGKQKSDVFINSVDSMEKLLEKKNIESIKSTMLIHEHIFKHQVSELHRLYSKQKNLMNDTRNDITMITGNHIPTTLGLVNLQELVSSELGQLGAQKIPHIARLSDTSTTNRAVDNEERRLHTQAMQNSSLYISTENNNSDTCNNKDDGGHEECDVDLSLGIGGKKKQMKTEGSSSSSSNQKNSLPHWLCQDLGSNKT